MYKYLHETSPGTFYLDHRLTPEVRAMLAAMASRAPLGGVKARYEQVVDAVAQELADANKLRKAEALAEMGGDSVSPPSPARKGTSLWDSCWKEAEDRLCEYPLHPRVQRFFDDFVGKYGHSSIMELTGDPAVYSEGISWYTAYLLFDSPLCAGQEFSTRAVQHKDWPMAREGYEYESTGIETSVDVTHNWVANPTLKELHDAWFEVFEAEVRWWTEHLSDEDNRKALGIADKEPFRPALDRARWALPGTIATGCCHTAPLRERARVLRDGALLAQSSGDAATVQVWDSIRDCYAKALPGLAGKGLREAHYDARTSILPNHFTVGEVGSGPDVELRVDLIEGRAPTDRTRPYGKPSYLDASYNHFGRVTVGFQCSLAVARDWHRHRTMYPWAMDIVTTDEDIIQINNAYEPKSDLAKEKVASLLKKSWEAHVHFMEEGHQTKAMMCLPLGTDVALVGQGGLRDAIYMLELRKNAVGANFEYKAQASTALELICEELEGVVVTDEEENMTSLLEIMGLVPSDSN